MTYFADMVSVGTGKGACFVTPCRLQKGAVMKRKSGIILTTVLVLCMFAGCKREPDTITLTPAPTFTVTPVPEHSVTPQPTTSVTHTVVPMQTTELPIYTINSDLIELMAVTALVPAENKITEEVVARAVEDALADSGIYVTVNSATKDGTVVTVDFSASAPPVTQVGANIEGMILDAFGQSILDNVTDCSGVAFSVDGGPYVSGHFELEKDDIYMRR